MASIVPAASEITEEKVTTVIAEDLHIKGSLRFETSLLIMGSLEGEITSEGLLVVGPTAKIKRHDCHQETCFPRGDSGGRDRKRAGGTQKDRRPNREHHYPEHHHRERFRLQRVDHYERKGRFFQVRGAWGIAKALLRKLMWRSSNEKNYEEMFKMRDVKSDVSNTDETSITTVLADDLHITGTITFKSSLMIKGTFDGEIVSEGLLVVGPTAKINATIVTKRLISHGEIKGDVTASEQVVLKATATQTGNITTPDIIVESGSIFNGSCMMKREVVAESPQNETGEEGSGLGTKAPEPYDWELQPQKEAAPLIQEETAEQAAPISEEHSGLPAEEAIPTEDVLSTKEPKKWF